MLTLQQGKARWEESDKSLLNKHSETPRVLSLKFTVEGR